MAPRGRTQTNAAKNGYEHEAEIIAKITQKLTL